jgi:hypothetical protein
MEREVMPDFKISREHSRVSRRRGCVARLPQIFLFVAAERTPLGCSALVAVRAAGLGFVP